MKLKMKKIALALLVLFAQTAWSAPSDEVIYESDSLKTKVYKDAHDPNVFWYIPPVKLLQKDDGSVVYYKRSKDGMNQYYFYLVPYMNDELVKFLANEIPGILNKSQLRPVVATQFAIQVPDYQALFKSDEVTDYYYLNTPHLIKINLSEHDAEDFEFFLSNIPGVKANIVFTFQSEKQDKWLTLSLTYEEVYKALGALAGGDFNGKNTFTKAQIERAIRNYLANKSLDVRGKGDLQIPEIVNKVIAECFVPVGLPSKNQQDDGGSGNPQNPYPFPPNNPNKPTPPNQGGGNHPCDPSDPNCSSPNPMGSNGGINPNWNLLYSGLEEPPQDPTNPPEPTPQGKKVELRFQFKMELANSKQNFLYKDVRYTDTVSVVSVPSFLTIDSLAVKSYKPQVLSLGKKGFIVRKEHTKLNPLHTGIIVGPNEQYIIDADFAIAARSTYTDGKILWFKKDVAKASVNTNLYYKVGDSPWIPLDTEDKIDGRAVIKADIVEKGELLFAMAPEQIFKKIDSRYTKSKFGIYSPIMTYSETYPQFNISVLGRKFDFQKK
jgi:hypothetical protein